MINLQNDLIINYFKLPLDTSWFIEMTNPVHVENVFFKPARITLYTIGSGQSQIDSPTIEKQVVPNEQLAFNERDVIKIVFNVEIKR